ncbi:hypothetical protein RHGRI_029209 [Rhododendron griersonianum]|uniref:E3 ubiquitin ligase UBR4 C-terminal domain-containing protein n=1 Tax=Rhododendron griersonianum TaxID=479676 RepID=A0AAV6IIF3_9ERIC|nr:hypothetical protein RHGRI_029209 [Rhododendron griersonianum]
MKSCCCFQRCVLWRMNFGRSRLRVVFQLLFSAIKSGAKHPAISAIIAQACTPPKPDMTDKEPGMGKPASSSDENNLNPSVHSCALVSGGKTVPESLEKSWDGSQKTQDMQLLSYSEWEKGASYLDFVRRQYKVCQAVKGGQRSRPQRYDYLALKYALRWKRRACKTKIRAWDNLRTFFTLLDKLPLLDGRPVIHYQGLDGEAIERMITELEEDTEESQDSSIAGAVREFGGLEIILGIIQIAYLITHKFPTFSPPNKQISKADEAVLVIAY